MAGANPRPLVAGNWKMNGLAGSEGELAKIVAGGAGLNCDLMVCPPATLVARFAAAAAGSTVAIGGQDCHPSPPAPIPAISRRKCWPMPAPRAVIVGHSERRADHHETDAQVQAKALAAWRAGLHGHRLRRGTKGRARSRQDPGRGRRPARRLAAGRRHGGQAGGRLRAGLGDRHRADPHAGRRREVHGFIRQRPGRAVSAGRARASASSMAARSSRPMPGSS